MGQPSRSKMWFNCQDLPVRLTPTEHQSITQILRALDPQSEVLLFGSRTDDQRKGGDIDLLWKTSRAIDLKTQLKAQWRLEVSCDTRVDLLVQAPDQPDQAIFRIARQTAKQLLRD
jgi:predicted nucleotidyltransferase